MDYLMNLNLIFTKTKKRFRELWNYKIFKYSIIIHSLYILICSILIIFWFQDFSDFKVFYKATEVFLTDITDLYNRMNYPYPYRYFPLSVIIFIPFYFMGFDIGFIMFTLFNLFLNILISVIVYKIVMLIRGEDHEKGDKRIIHYICLYAIGLPQISNYFLGQNNLIITFLIVLSLLIYLRKKDLKWQFVASLLIGISIVVKPITITLIPFLLLVNVDLRRKIFKIDFIKSLIRVLGCLTPLALNLIYFFLFPKLWEAFLLTNFTGVEPVDINFSFSVSKIIINFYYFIGVPYNQVLILFVVLLIFGGLGFLIYVFRRFSKHALIYGYTLGILITLIVYFDTWDHHLLNLTPLLLIILFNLPRNSKIAKRFIKPSFIFFNFFNLVFMGLFVLFKDIFPLNFIPMLFLLLVFYGIARYCIIQQNSNNASEIS